MVEEKGMDSKQWAWLYQQIKSFVRDHEGHVPDDQAVSEWFKLHDFIIDMVARSEKKRPGTDEQLSAVFNSIINAMQSLELEKKPL